MWEELKKSLEAKQLPESLQLNKETFIFDLPKMVKNHINFIENNRGNKAYMPYFLRLKQIDKIC